jgi:hypothetical protein
LIRRGLILVAALGGYQGGSSGDRQATLSVITAEACVQTPADRLVIRFNNGTCLYVEVLAGSGAQATPAGDYSALLDVYGNSVVVGRRGP